MQIELVATRAETSPSPLTVHSSREILSLPISHTTLSPIENVYGGGICPFDLEDLAILIKLYCGITLASYSAITNESRMNLIANQSIIKRGIL